MKYFPRGITISTRKLPDEGPVPAYVGVVVFPSGSETYTERWRRSRDGARADATRLASSLAADGDFPVDLL